MRKAALRVLCVALAPALLTMCVASQQQAHTDVSIGGGYSEPHYRSLGCGNVIGEHTDRITTATARVERQTESAARFGVAATGVHGKELLGTSQTNANVGTPEWSLAAVGGWIGARSQYVGVDVGGFVHSQRGLLPFASLQFGKMDKLFGEIRLMSKDVPADPSLLTGHVRFVNDRYALGVGAGFYGRFGTQYLASGVPNTLTAPSFGTLTYDGYLDAGGQLEGEYWPTDTVGVRAHGTFGKNWFASLAVVMRFASSKARD